MLREKNQTDVASAGVAVPSSVEQPLPRIVALTHEFYPQMGGIATYAQEVARAAHRLGYPIEVWAPENPQLVQKDFEFPIRGLPPKGDQGWPSRIRLARRLIQTRSDWKNSVIWLPEPGPMRMWMYFSLLRQFSVKGLVLTLHGSEIGLFTSRWHRRKLFGHLVHCADRISVVSRYCRERLLSYYPEIEEKVFITHGALRADVSGIAEPVDGSFKNGRIVILTVGRIHPRKGQLAVIEALGRMDPDMRDRFVYRCVGPIRRAGYLHTLEQSASVLGVHFEYAGEIDSKALNEEYLHSDIFAMTSTTTGHSVEGFGLTYLEASAYGLPIVAHRTGGVADAVRDGFNGLKVDCDDRDALALAFRALARSQDLRSRLGENGRRWAHSFSWANTAKTLFAGIGTEAEEDSEPEEAPRHYAGKIAAML